MNTNRKFYKELSALAVPFALQGLLNALVGASDALMLGRLTQQSIAAVSLANQVSFVMSLFLGAIIGSVGVLVAQYYGKGDFAAVRRLLCMALRYAAAIAVVFFALAFCWTRERNHHIIIIIYKGQPDTTRSSDNG